MNTFQIARFSKISYEGGCKSSNWYKLSTDGTLYREDYYANMGSMFSMITKEQYEMGLKKWYDKVDNEGWSVYCSTTTRKEPIDSCVGF